MNCYFRFIKSLLFQQFDKTAIQENNSEEYSIDRLLSFQQLSTFFLDSTNPRPEKYIVILNCILDYTGPLPEKRLRHFCHSFFCVAERAIEHNIKLDNGDAEQYVYWIRDWLENDRDLS